MKLGPLDMDTKPKRRVVINGEVLPVHAAINIWVKEIDLQSASI